MKKLIVMFFAIGCFAAFNVNAQVSDMSTDTSGVNVDRNEQNRDSYNSNVSVDKGDLIKIRISELPSMVTQTLGNSEYSGWTIVNAYRTKNSDQYLVEVKKGSQTQSYWFDKNGNRTNKSGSSMNNDKSGNNNKSGTSGAGKSGTSGMSGTSGTSGSGTSGTSGSSGSSGTGTSGTGTSGSSSGTTDR